MVWIWLAVVGTGLGLSTGPLLTQSLAHVPAAVAADASGLLTTTVQLGQLIGVAAIGSVYLSRAASIPASRAASIPGSHAAAAMSSSAVSAAACWLAALSALGLLAAMIMVRSAARGEATARTSPARRLSASS